LIRYELITQELIWLIHCGRHFWLKVCPVSDITLTHVIKLNYVILLNYYLCWRVNVCVSVLHWLWVLFLLIKQPYILTLIQSFTIELSILGLKWMSFYEKIVFGEIGTSFFGSTNDQLADVFINILRGPMITYIRDKFDTYKKERELEGECWDMH